MKIIIINMASAVERRQHLEEKLSALGANFEFFPAVTPADEPEKLFRGTSRWICRLETGRPVLEPRELACYASHLGVWNRCIELNEPVILLEDDVQPAACFAQHIPAIDNVIDKYGFIRLEAREDIWNYYRNREQQKPAPVDAETIDGLTIEHPTFMHLRTSAYALTPAAASRLVYHSRTAKCPVDNFVRRTWTHRQPMFMTNPPLFELTEQAEDSQIGGREIERKKGFFLTRQFYRRSKHVYWWWARRSSWREARRVRAAYGLGDSTL